MSGRHAVLRHLYGGRVAYVQPVTVVHDRPDEIALYLAAGTPCKHVDGLEPLARGDWTCRDRTHERTDVLMLVRPDDWYAIWLMWWHDSGEFWQWYVNFQLPLEHTLLGFDTADKTLDITVAPDGRWQWKDEEEFAYAQELGVVRPEEARAIRDAAPRVIADIESGAYPFTERWLSWRPDPRWSIPGIPAGWERAAVDR